MPKRSRTGYRLPMVVALSLAAACCFGLASVLQQRAAAAASVDHNLRLKLLTHLVQRPMWLAGVLAGLAGVLLQVLALRFGSLIIVQVLLVANLEFALVLEATLWRQRLRRREWLAGGVVCIGLSLFLLVGAPTGGRERAPIATWVVAVAATAIVVLSAVVAARRATDAHRAVFLALAAGVVLGLSAALSKVVVTLLGEGVPSVLTSWEVYVLVVVAIGGLLLAQSAFQVGSLAASLPTITVAGPIASIALGVTVFAERVSSGPLAVLLELAAALTIIAGVFTLARAPRPGLITAKPPAGTQSKH